MKAVMCLRYGAPELHDLSEPAVPDDGVRVRVRAASINALDWYGVAGRPYVFRIVGGFFSPRGREAAGVDFAGTVESTGSRTSRFRPGDEVFGAGQGAFAELVSTREERIAAKPPGVTFEQAACLPIAGLTALQGLRDKARLQPGQRVLINGASGGVGTFMVQIAKTLGAHVTAVCGARHVEAIRALGADEVVDYTREDFTRSGRRYDLLVDVAGSQPWSRCRRVLERDGACLLVGGPRRHRWLGPLGHFASMKLSSMLGRQKLILFVAKASAQDLATLADYVAEGKVKPLIDRCYPLAEIAAALRHFDQGHPSGKIVLIANRG